MGKRRRGEFPNFLPAKSLAESITIWHVFALPIDKHFLWRWLTAFNTVIFLYSRTLTEAAPALPASSPCSYRIDFVYSTLQNSSQQSQKQAKGLKHIPPHYPFPQSFPVFFLPGLCLWQLSKELCFNLATVPRKAVLSIAGSLPGDGLQI